MLQRRNQPQPTHTQASTSQVTVADVDGDSQLEVVAGDTLGTLAVFTAQGHEVWERHVKSGLSQVPA